MIDGVASFTSATWNHPRFQGGLQAFGGLTETLIGAGMTLALPPVGGVVTAHGLSGLRQSHFNKLYKMEVYEPHIHDPHFPGGVRPALGHEIPK